MNRVNFARCSQVVVDVCSKHGTWFDKDELRRIVEFLRSGALEAARQREIAELEEQRRRARANQMADAWDSRLASESFFGEKHEAISSVGSLLRLLRGD